MLFDYRFEALKKMDLDVITSINYVEHTSRDARKTQGLYLSIRPSLDIL